MAEEILLDPVDQKNRKDWLYVTVAYLLLSSWPIAKFIWQLPSSDKRFHLFSSMVVWGMLLFVCAIHFSLLYYFSYRKHGNKLLIVYLVFSIFSTLKSLPMLFLFLHSSLFDIFAQTLRIAVYGWWVFLSIKLIKINKKIRLQKHKVLNENPL